MCELRYVVRVFKGDQYLYSVHVSDEALPMLVQKAKDSGENVKVIAYKADVQESEVSNA